jgi:Tol biopolymer transport system component
MLPDGEPKQLTHDGLNKMSPVFSPDGSRIAYTTLNQQSNWDTWTVPALGGEPRPWLANASGLVWKDARTVLFSEVVVRAHMGVKAAEESRAAERQVYLPERQSGMAHRSYPSPDGKWALIVEMDGPWLPCRVVPMDGSSAGHSVGPQGAACTFAAWSPDGKWMYFSSSAGGSFHTWRQRFPKGAPEQITSGPTEEEGIAIAADGGSFITAVGQRQRPVSLHMPGGDRQISLEGYAYDPRFTPGFKKLCYRILKGSQPSSDPTQLWIADLDSGSTQELWPGYFVLGGGHQYSFSPDGREVVFSGGNGDVKSRRLWLAPLDRHSAPRPIPNAEGGRMPYFAPGGEIYFPGADGFVYQIRSDGTGKRRMFDRRVAEIHGLSPDGQWIVGVNDGVLAFPVGGGSPVPIRSRFTRVRWSQDGKLMFIQGGAASMSSGATGRNYVFPLKPARCSLISHPTASSRRKRWRNIQGFASSRPQISHPDPRPMSTRSRKKQRSGTCSGFRCAE